MNSRTAFLDTGAKLAPFRDILLSLLALTILVGTACGAKKSESELASEALERGLKAHVDGRLDEANAAYREVLVHDPRNKFAFYNLGLIEQTAGRTQSAESNYRLALSADPNYVPALYNLAIVRTQLGANQEAADLYRRAILITPSDATLHLNLGYLLRSMGLEADGNAELRRALELDPRLAARIPVDLDGAPAR